MTMVLGHFRGNPANDILFSFTWIMPASVHDISALVSGYILGSRSNWVGEWNVTFIPLQANRIGGAQVQVHSCDYASVSETKQ